jgi:hypothetical protein
MSSKQVLRAAASAASAAATAASSSDAAPSARRAKGQAGGAGPREGAARKHSSSNAGDEADTRPQHARARSAAREPRKPSAGPSKAAKAAAGSQTAAREAADVEPTSSTGASKKRKHAQLTDGSALYASYGPGAAPDATALAMHTDDLSSDDEAPRNTIGNVPLEWYKDYEHIGYDLTGQKIVKKTGKDGIDRFLASQDDPHYK